MNNACRCVAVNMKWKRTHMSDIYVTDYDHATLAGMGAIVLKSTFDTAQERRQDIETYVASFACFNDIDGNPVAIADPEALVEDLVNTWPVAGNKVDPEEVAFRMALAGVFPAWCRDAQEVDEVQQPAPASIEFGRNGVFVTAEEYAAMPIADRHRIFGAPSKIVVPTVAMRSRANN